MKGLDALALLTACCIHYEISNLIYALNLTVCFDRNNDDALQFKEILRQKLTAEEDKALTHAQNYISQVSHGSKLDHHLKGKRVGEHTMLYGII